MPINAVPQPETDRGLHLHHRVMYYVIRPVVKRLPVAVFAMLAMAVAIPLGLLQAFRRAGYYRRVLECAGRSNTLAERVRLAILSTYAKARHLDWYIYECTPHVQITWDGGPETERCIYICAHTYGLENVTAWMDRCPSTIVRYEWAGEGKLDLATASPGLKWRAHQAHMRQRHAATHKHVIVGQNPMASRKLYAARESIIFYQDLNDPTKPDGPPLLGYPVTLRMGALRIARRAGNLPLRYMKIIPRGGTWHFHIGPRIPATYEAIAGAIEADIRARPAQWMLWGELFNYVDGPSPTAASTATAARRESFPARHRVAVQ